MRARSDGVDLEDWRDAAAVILLAAVILPAAAVIAVWRRLRG